jgi:hypothetical protein
VIGREAPRPPSTNQDSDRFAPNARKSALAETFDCRVTCIEKAEEFDSRGAEKGAKRVWTQSSISLLGLWTSARTR